MRSLVLALLLVPTLALAQVRLLDVGTGTGTPAGEARGGTSCPDNLTPEEEDYQRQGLLPPNYGCLKASDSPDAYRAGKKGPFYPEFGAPAMMLRYARAMVASPELLRFVKEVKRGDIVVYDYRDPSHFPSIATRGSWGHSTLCVKDGPLPEFVSATGSEDSIVWRVMANYEFETSTQIRILRPAGSFPQLARSSERSERAVPGAERPPHPLSAGHGGRSEPAPGLARSSERSERAVPRAERRSRRSTAGLDRRRESARGLAPSPAAEKAAAYVEAQLGKKYDFAYAQATGTPARFYCSNLPYLAYAMKDGANLPFPLDKSAYRDEYIVAMRSILGNLRADDPARIIDRAAEFSRGAPPTSAQIADYVVDDVLAHCGATAKAVDDPVERGALKRVVRMFVDNDFLPSTRARVREYEEARKRGAFDGFVGAGRQALAAAKISGALFADEARFAALMGFSLVKLGPRLGPVIILALPFTELAVALMCGEDHPATRAVRTATDILAWLQEKQSYIPFLPAPIIQVTPRDQRKPAEGFVSPTDLAWSQVPKMDFNVTTGERLDELVNQAGR